MVVNCATVGLDRIARPAEVGCELEPPSGIFLRRPRKGKCREGTSGIEQPFYVPSRRGSTAARGSQVRGVRAVIPVAVLRLSRWREEHGYRQLEEDSGLDHFEGRRCT